MLKLSKIKHQIYGEAWVEAWRITNARSTKTMPQKSAIYNWITQPKKR